MAKKVLLIGGCGSMGSYLTPKLLETGCAVDVATDVPGCLTAPGLRYLLTDAKDVGNLQTLLAAHYDAVIDFLDYGHADYLGRYELFLKPPNVLPTFFEKSYLKAIIPVKSRSK